MEIQAVDGLRTFRKGTVCIVRPGAIAQTTPATRKAGLRARNSARLSIQVLRQNVCEQKWVQENQGGTKTCRL